MTTNAVVRARIDEHIKEEASAVLAAMGLTVSDAFRIMLTREQCDLFRQTLRFLRRNDDRRADGIHEHAQLCRVQLPAAIAVCVFVALFGADDVKAIPAEDVNIVADRVPVPAVPACFANIHQLG